jgi:hypothetical protein
LPAGRRQQGHAGAPPAFGQHQAQGHRRGADQADEQAERVEAGDRCQHGQSHPGGADQRGEHSAQGDPLGQQQPAQTGHDQGLSRAEDGRHAAGQPIGADEEHGEEEADVERAEHGRAPPPHTAGKAPGQGDEQQAGREGA